MKSTSPLRRQEYSSLSQKSTTKSPPSIIFSSVISPAILEFDFHIVALRHSQKELADEIDRITQELQSFLSTCTSTAPQLESPISRLAALRRRMVALSGVLGGLSGKLAKVVDMAELKRNVEREGGGGMDGERVNAVGSTTGGSTAGNWRDRFKTSWL